MKNCKINKKILPLVIAVFFLIFTSVILANFTTSCIITSLLLTNKHAENYVIFFMFALVILMTICFCYCYVKITIINPLLQLIKSFKNFLSAEDMEVKIINSNEDIMHLSILIRNLIKSNAVSNNELLISNMRCINNELKIKTIFNNIGDALLTCDQNGILQMINPAALEIFGYSEKELLNNNMICIFSEQSYSLYEEVMGYIKNSDQSNTRSIFKAEFIAINSSGKLFPADITLSKIIQKIDNQHLNVLTIRDISQFKKQELELMLSKKRVEKSNEVKNDFLSNMSHEIRTPLSGITSMIDLIMMTDLNNEQIELFKLLKKSAESFLLLMSDILDYNNIEASQNNVNYSPVILLDLINEIISSFTIKVIEKNLNFSSSISDKLPVTILSDYRWLKNIFYHLINNAIKFTKEGFVSLNINIIKENDDEFLVIMVEDTGIGIDRDDFGKIFLPFSQVNNSDNRQYGGTGLGLTIVKRIVDIFDGKINIESEINVGSIFEVKLPIIK